MEMSTAEELEETALLGRVRAQVFALQLIEKGLVPAMATGDVCELAVSIEDWNVVEVPDDGMEYLITDDNSFSVTRGLLRKESGPGPEDGQLRVDTCGQGFLLGGSARSYPPAGSPVYIEGYVSVEPMRMPMFGFDNPRAWPMRRPWKVVALHRELLPRGGVGGRKPAMPIERLPNPADVDTGSYYFADLVLP
ncbi:hypothetical protein [Actinomycetospora flava]|uniref:Uncharacterized protein n=1 Tax=Actinomycetospora flava TaxID=3129232 RepID=A0ABU8M662_9PSEU